MVTFVIIVKEQYLKNVQTRWTELRSQVELIIFHKLIVEFNIGSRRNKIEKIEIN